jgi:hypothetical protein
MVVIARDKDEPYVAGDVPVLRFSCSRGTVRSCSVRLTFSENISALAGLWQQARPRLSSDRSGGPTAGTT